MEEYLFVIDYQNDFVDGALGFPGAETLDGPIARRVRQYGPGRVFFTRDTHGPDYLSTREGRHLPAVHCVKGTAGWELFGETAVAIDEVGARGIDKAAFGIDVTDPAVAAVLPERADRIELCGLVSNICVISNAAVLQSRYPQAQIVVDARLTGSFDPALNEKTLDVLRGLQVEILGR
ncbi:cysteine hydrolase [Oscillibacter sp. MSJ-2]|uniref:Cysteine hydrolase n=1 Tax=Dysosmobacter acutus TaxID=2841504 RepID=A0ABS6F6Q3_9FIRM|nr:isochorismatase family cysteine hydrolase [Dysosmobacter acutus]MBU5625968.1 cysteine hydrolase [Dysosmobacter acutus]